jgi:hypothetical protein
MKEGHVFEEIEIGLVNRVTCVGKGRLSRDGATSVAVSFCVDFDGKTLGRYVCQLKTDQRYLSNTEAT